MLWAVCVTTKDHVALYSLYNYLNNDTLTLYHGDGGCNNGLTAWKYVIYMIFQIELGVRSFKHEFLLLAVSVATKDRVSLYSIYNNLNNGGGRPGGQGGRPGGGEARGDVLHVV